MIDVDQLRKKFDEKNYFNSIDAEYICRVKKCVGFEANEQKGRMHPTWIANLEIVECLTNNDKCNKPGEVCFIGYKLNDKRQMKQLEDFANAAGQILSSEIFDIDMYQIKGKLHNKLVKVGIKMNGQWANIYFNRLNADEFAAFGPDEPQILAPTSPWGEQKSQTWGGAPEPEDDSTWGGKF